MGSCRPSYQGTAFNAERPINHLDRPPEIAPGDDRAARDFLRLLNDEHLKQHAGDTELSARIAAYELAGRMQLSAPEVGDLSRESPATRCTVRPGRSQCAHGRLRPQLLARPPAARARRAVYHAFQWRLRHGRRGAQLGRTPPHPVRLQSARADPRPARGRASDRPQSARATRRHARRLDDRVRPHAHVSEGDAGRDHNPKGFTAWLAGAGVKHGFSFGATDEFGYQAVENVVDVHDFHATILHLLGLDHERLTYNNNGTSRRLTDVHGHVIRGRAGLTQVRCEFRISDSDSQVRN